MNQVWHSTEQVPPALCSPHTATSSLPESCFVQSFQATFWSCSVCCLSFSTMTFCQSDVQDAEWFGNVIYWKGKIWNRWNYKKKIRMNIIRLKMQLLRILLKKEKKKLVQCKFTAKEDRSCIRNVVVLPWPVPPQGTTTTPRQVPRISEVEGRFWKPWTRVILRLQPDKPNHLWGGRRSLLPPVSEYSKLCWDPTRQFWLLMRSLGGERGRESVGEEREGRGRGGLYHFPGMMARRRAGGRGDHLQRCWRLRRE